MAPEIRAPIFIVGSPRSGTSLLYEKLSMHPDLAWISNITKKVAGSLLATRAIMLFRDDHHPTEAKKVWSRFSPSEDSARTRQDVTPRARRYLRRVVRNNLKLTGRPRFLSKNPHNSLRIGFLDEIFPDALFVHIIRDGRAVAQSAVRSRRKKGGEFRGIRIPGWQDLVDRPMIEVAGIQWRTTVEMVRESAAELPAERYIEVRYEELAESPFDVLEEIGRKCALEWDPVLLRDLVSDVKSQNYKWRSELTPTDLEILDAVIGDLLRELGYDG